MLIALLAAVCCCMPAAAAPPPGLVELADLGVQMVLPEGWEIARAVDDRGVSLVNPGSDDPVLEVVAWDPVATELSAHAAARAHEQVLATGAAYERLEQEVIQIPGGGQAVVVRGALRTEGDGEWTALFAAYLLGRRYFILGTFVRPEGLARVRSELFDAAARSFCLSGTQFPDPDPAPRPEPAEPSGPVEPAEPVAPPGAADPATATIPAVPADPPVDPVTASLIPIQPLEGVAMMAPRGWQARVDRGCIFVEPAEKPRRFGACVWPVFRSENAPLERRTVSVCRDWAQLMGARWRNVATRVEPGDPLCAISRGSLRVDGEAVLALATLSAHDGYDMLHVLYFAEDTPAAQRLNLCGVPASFRAEPVHVFGTGPQDQQRWAAADGALEADGLPGWLVSGGVRIYNGLPAIDIMGLQPRTGARFSWRQPEIPMYRDLSGALSDAGWREGSEFPPDLGAEPLILWRRSSAVEACASRARGEAGLKLTVSGEAPNAARMLEGAQGSFARASGDGIDASSLCALAPAPQALGADCWMVASLRYEAPAGSHNDAGAALRRLIESVRVRPYWPATNEQRRILETMAAGVREAAQDLPEGSREMTGGIERWPLLVGTVAPGTDGARVVELPPGNILPWAQATDAQAARTHLPEILETW